MMLAMRLAGGVLADARMVVGQQAASNRSSMIYSALLPPQRDTLNHFVSKDCGRSSAPVRTGMKSERAIDEVRL